LNKNIENGVNKSKCLINVIDNVRVTDEILKKSEFIYRFGKVESNFYCFFTNINSLEGSQYELTGVFNCRFCTKLKTLKHAPIKVKNLISKSCLFNLL
jgi:hypothetical protein